MISRGPLKGVIDLTYLNPSRKSFRSRVDVSVSLGIFPKAKSIRQMPRELLALIAQETREKFLVAEQLFCVCDPAYYEYREVGLGWHMCENTVKICSTRNCT